MKFLKIINLLIIVFNTTLVFVSHKEPTKTNTYDKPLVFSKDRFYQKTPNKPNENTKEVKINWRELYLDDSNQLDQMNQELVKNIKFNGEGLKNFEYFNPTATIWQRDLENRFEMYAIVNGEYRNQPWNQIKDSIKEGDEVIFFKKSIQYTYLDGIYPNQNNYYCKIKDTSFHFASGYPWLIELKVPIVGQTKLKSVWKPIYIPNTEFFCDTTNAKATNWSMYLKKDSFNFDLSRNFEIGKMFFLNNEFLDSKYYIEITSDKKPFWEGDNIRIPYKAGKKIGIENLRTSGDYEIKKIKHDIPVFKMWSFGNGSYIKPFKATGFVKQSDFSNKKLVVNYIDKVLIVKNILKTHNYFDFNVFSTTFKEIRASWANPTQNNERQSLTITMLGKNETKNYNFDIWYKTIVDGNIKRKNELDKQNRIANEIAEKQEQEKMKTQREKHKYKHNFSIEKSHSIFQNKQQNFSIVKSATDKIKSQKKWFYLLGLAVAFIMFFFIKK